MIEIKDSDTMISEMEQLRESHMSTISKRHQELNASLKTFMDEIDKNNAEIKNIDLDIQETSSKLSKDIEELDSILDSLLAD